MHPDQANKGYGLGGRKGCDFLVTGAVNAAKASMNGTRF